jgi:hypothetical protein
VVLRYDYEEDRSPPAVDSATTLWRKEACFFVPGENATARGVYERAGFVIGEDTWADVSLCRQSTVRRPREGSLQ